MWVAGVDGCRAGWMAVLVHRAHTTPPRAAIFETFADILDLPECPQFISADMPIGLPGRAGPGGRACDGAVRRVLGERQSSVFSLPARAAVQETDFRRACSVALEHSDPPRKVSIMCFNLFPKIREVDALLRARGHARVFETHPEAAFWAMNGCRPLELPKKVKSRPHEPGLDLRRNLLTVAYPWPDGFLAQRPWPASAAGPDDLLDACACAWTALRIAAGTARRFPERTGASENDGEGLRMEIWA